MSDPLCLSLVVFWDDSKGFKVRHALFLHVIYKEHFPDVVSHLTHGTHAWNTVIVVSV